MRFAAFVLVPLFTVAVPEPPPPSTGIGTADGGCLVGTFPDCQEPATVVAPQSVAVRPLPVTR